MEQYSIEISAQGRENIEETIATLMEAAQAVANASEQDFTAMKNKKWYKRLWEVITFNRDNQKVTARGVQNLAKLNEIIMKAIVILARYSADTAQLVSESLKKIENLEDFLGQVTAGLSKVASEVKKLKYNYKRSLTIDDLNVQERDIVGSIFVKYVKQCLMSGIIPNTASQKLYAFAMQGDTPEDDINISTHIDLINGDVQQLLYRLNQSYYYLIKGEFDESDYYDDFDISNKNMKIIRQQIQDAVLFCGAENYTDCLVIDNALGIVDDSEVDFDTEDKISPPTYSAPENMLSSTEMTFLSYKTEETFALFSALALQGNGRACYFLGEFYTNHFGNAVQEDKEKAKNWFSIGAERGDVLSKLNCAYLADGETIRDSIFTETFPSVLALAQQGDIFAMDEVADMYASGYGTQKDDENADYWLKKAANTGYWRSQTKLGERYENMEQYTEAFEFYSKADDLGYEHAIYFLGALYATGRGVEKDCNKAFELYEIAAKKGDLGAQLWMGIAYDFQSERFGITQDLFEAEKWYKLVADSNSHDRYVASACWNLAFLIHHKPFEIENPAKELRYLIKASMLGREDATIEMAVRLCSGEGVTEDMMKQEFGEREWKDTKTLVGDLWQGFISKDMRAEELKKRGKEILEKYAEKGNGKAQYYLGILYTDYMWFGKDKYLARKWLLKAKENHVKEADYAYGVVSKNFWVLGPSLIYFVH